MGVTSEIEDSTGEYSIAPLLEPSGIDGDGRIEVGVSVAGDDPIDENELDVFLKRSRIDPGDRIELGIFVSGTDQVAATELGVFHDHEDVIDLDEPGTVRRRGGDGAPDSSTGGPTPGRADGTAPGGIESTAEYIHSTASELGDSADATLRRKPLGGTGTGGPGYILEINTRATAPPGAYPLPIVFTYRSADGIKQVKEVRTVHLTIVTTATIYTLIAQLSCDQVCIDLQWLL